MICPVLTLLIGWLKSQGFSLKCFILRWWLYTARIPGGIPPVGSRNETSMLQLSQVLT